MTSLSTGTGRQWLKITFACPAVLLEAAGDLLAVLSGSGVEQSPPTAEGAAVSGFFELHGAGGDHPPERAEAVVSLVEARMAELFALYRQEPVRATHTLLADEDWATSWQQYFKPFAIVPGLVIKPSWEAYAPAAGERVIEMDPGMAFGTGQHASTRMALGLIAARLEQDPCTRALDVGDWLHLVGGDGRSEPAKVSWISPISGRLLLVNRRGIRVLVASAEELAAMVKLGKVSLREGATAFDDAMHQVTGRLQNAANHD